MVDQKRVMDIVKDYSGERVPALITIDILNAMTSKNSIDDLKPIAVFLEAKYYIDSSHQDLTGFEVIYKLRQELRFKGSIVVFSFLERGNIKKINYKNKQRYPERILDTSNIEFFSIDGTKQNQIEIQNAINDFLSYRYKLENLGLEDILSYVSNYKYLLNEAMHDFRNRNNYQEISQSDNFKQLKEDILLFIKQEDIIKVNIFLDEKSNQKDDDFDSNYDEIKNQLQRYLKINEFSGSLNGDSDSILKREWEILYIDDDPEACECFQNLFSEPPYSITCHTASNMNDVNNYAREIDSDVENKIYWVICDYRLKKHSNWFPLQGYDLLVNSFENPKLLRSIFTTATNLITESARSSDNDQNINWYNKSLMINNADYFRWVIDSKINLIDENFNNRDAFKYPSSWFSDNKPYVSPFNQGIRFIELFTKIQKIKANYWTSYNQSIDKVAITFFKNILNINSNQKKDIEKASLKVKLRVEIRNSNLNLEFKKFNIELEAKLTDSNFEDYMYKRLLIRKLLIGYQHLFNQGLLDNILNSENNFLGRNQKSIINQLSGFYPRKIKTKNRLNYTELHKDDIAFLNFLDSNLYQEIV